jgi:hypothetical protein
VGGPSQSRVEYLVGSNEPTRCCIQQDPDGGEEDSAKRVYWFVELESGAHSDLAGLPIFALQIENR